MVSVSQKGIWSRIDSPEIDSYFIMMIYNKSDLAVQWVGTFAIHGETSTGYPNGEKMNFNSSTSQDMQKKSVQDNWKSRCGMWSLILLEENVGCIFMISRWARISWNNRRRGKHNRGNSKLNYIKIKNCLPEHTIKTMKRKTSHRFCEELYAMHIFNKGFVSINVKNPETKNFYKTKAKR